MLMRCVILQIVVLIMSTSVSFAACYVKEDEKWTVIGRFPFEYAYKSCVTVFRKYYLRERSQGNAELYLQCHSGRILIATSVNFKVYTTGMEVAGCIMPKTLG